MPKQKKKVFDLDTQKLKGGKGEKAFLKQYASVKAAKIQDCPEYDFTINDTETVELKTDYYEGSPNFFMERFSDHKAKTPGGPWRAKEDNVRWFVYYFVKEKIFYWFNPLTLCEFLDKYIVTQAYVKIKNTAWTTIGYKIPKVEINDLATKVDKHE